MTRTNAIRLSLSIAIVFCGFSTLPILAAEPAETPAPVDQVLPPLELDNDTVTNTGANQPVPPPAEPLKAKAVVVDINSNTFNYDTKRDVYVATGQVHVVISEQNSELFADKVTYDQNQELILAEGHVVILKNGQRTDGGSAKIDLTRKSALINDMSTEIEAIRVKSKEALVSNDYLQLENGRLLITRQNMGGITKANQSKPGNNRGGIKMRAPSYYDQNPSEDFGLANLGKSANAVQGNDPGPVKYADEPLYLGDAEEEDSDPGASNADFMKIHAKEIDVQRWEDGYTKVDMTKPKLKVMNKFTFPLIATGQASFDETTQQIDYLGPDIGYDPDLGGFYGGPGWDFRLGEGTFRFSPLVSYGGGGRRRRGGSRYETLGVGPGVGGIMHYRDANTMIDASYNSRVGQPIGYFERKIFDGHTKLVASINDDYTAGFMNFERPGYGMMINDTRTLKQFGNFQLDSYASAGYFKDEFFPNNLKDEFIDADDKDLKEPGTAGRAQLQFQLRNTKPLLSVGNFLDFGLRAQVASAAYTTGDFAGVLRGGPTMDLRIGNRFTTNMRYFFAQEVGETPFVFDDYYQGRQSISMQTAYRVNRFLTVGTRSNISLLKDNARGDLFTGNALYFLAGPRDVKFNIAYDVVRKRSYFGINFYPGARDRAVDFDTMRVFQPEAYAPSLAQP